MNFRCVSKSLVFIGSFLAALSACSRNDDAQVKYAGLCKQLKKECVTTCANQTFNTCYVDKKQFPDGPYSMTENCYATHVGQMCQPCTHIFAVSFGGAFPEVSCEEFLASIDRKNGQCDNCLLKIGVSPFSF